MSYINKKINHYRLLSLVISLSLMSTQIVNCLDSAVDYSGRNFIFFSNLKKNEKRLRTSISMIRKQPEEIVPPPINEMDWYDKRAIERGVDISKFK